MDLTKEELSFLESLICQKGWKIYILLLQGLFNLEYAKLRMIDNDYDLSGTQGMLNGIERCMTFIDSELADANANKEEVVDKGNPPQGD